MLIARIEPEPLVVPDVPFPDPPYRFEGRGITLIYEIPCARVTGGHPPCFEPDPGRGKVWFMVCLYDWQNFHPLADPNDRHTFLESYYKFSVKVGDRLGDFPVKLYLTSPMGIASGIRLYGYPKYGAEMSCHLEEEGGRFSVTREGRSELDVELARITGLRGRVTTFLTNLAAAAYLKRYTGNFLYTRNASGERLIHAPTRIREIRYAPARVTRIHLREPLAWGLLTEREAARPRYAFILPRVVAELEGPQPLPLHP